MKNEELQNYIQMQIVQSPRKLKGMANDMQGNQLFKRFDFPTLRKYLDEGRHFAFNPQIAGKRGNVNQNSTIWRAFPSG